MTSDHRKVFYKLPGKKRTRSPDPVGRAMDPLEPGGKRSTLECAGRPMEPPELEARSYDLPRKRLESRVKRFCKQSTKLKRVRAAPHFFFL
ncbi:unnamed protein product [Caenorhabditis auriculariae]|uniref:Uncharacterized protein n=1 Tax=Caenorhabditis auriculariae TaxID=2777116 RepID=A0A8S1HHC2_9PELO|nr:unnamed protein product [Caenorhabditis auriculariae]